ncbi:hypothetical protein E0L21_19800 [Kosakonia quasisacchari]|uniref:Uncharacterized protein n=1 Tax=Kosakonia quasisacchari TaxID=2529380 RepID=A0A4R0GUW6_9ENTR|nr:hypothetical protein [Kosakonia quasisacchari]TCC00878.1 hypothetical protein E0L21_19800 [Kosakonia quasisacchari]
MADNPRCAGEVEPGENTLYVFFPTDWREERNLFHLTAKQTVTAFCEKRTYFNEGNKKAPDRRLSKKRLAFTDIGNN